MPSEDSESYSVDRFIEFIDDLRGQNPLDVHPPLASPSETSGVDWLYQFEDDALNADENPPA